MSHPIVECIPNFSEARRPEVVKAILRAITSVEGISLLDHHPDEDHNRTVVTFAGAPEAVEEAAFRGIRKAAELIDLNRHTGSHPRIGATDVVPFVPIANISMDECVAMARRLGERVGTELNIPVYLYEEAAARPDRRNLEDIRRGQYEGLKVEVISNPERKPDFGPACLGPAGATVIGARQPLIAFNIYLDTEEVEIAKSIAKAIRQASGGLPFVKALGMLVDCKAQVSMNLTNFRKTPVLQVVEAICKETRQHGVHIHHGEVVGLIPQEALTETAIQALQLEGFQAEQILEERLKAIVAQPEPSFLDALAAGTPAPGGGSAAAYAGAMSAALIAMVAHLTIGKKKYAEVEAQVKEILAQAERLRAELTEAIQKDADAFEEVMAAFKLPKDTAEQNTARQDAIEEATRHAAEVPLDVARHAITLMALAERLAALGNLNAITDAGSAAAMARASLTAAAYNVRINLLSLNNKPFIDKTSEQLATVEEKANKLEKQIQKVMATRGKI